MKWYWWEKVSVVLCSVLAVVLIVECVDVLTQKNRVYASPDDVDEYFTVQETEASETAEFEPSGMPCENREQFEAWYEDYCETAEGMGDEQETGEEVEDVSNGEASNLREEAREVRAGESYFVGSVSETTPEAEEQGDQTGARFYSVNSTEIDQEITDALMDALERHGISYWIEGAIAQCYQESRFNRWAVSKDGRDYGILQYRAQYWGDTLARYGYSGADIYDMHVQFDIYATQMAARFNAGLSVDEAISRHKTSDDVPVMDWQYVSEVKQWLNEIQEY